MLFVISLIALGLAFVALFVFNLIVMPVKRQRQKMAQGQHDFTEYDPKMYYHINKPMILRQAPFLNFLVEHGGLFFFSIFSIFLLIAVYSASHSIFWTLLCISALFPLYAILNIVSQVLSTLSIKER